MEVYQSWSKSTLSSKSIELLQRQDTANEILSHIVKASISLTFIKSLKRQGADNAILPQLVNDLIFITLDHHLVHMCLWMTIWPHKTVVVHI